MRRRIELLYPNICPIWETECRIQRSPTDADVYAVHQSFRAGAGTYKITADACEEVPILSDDEKARLTSMLVEQWMRGVDVPTLKIDDVRRARDSQKLPAYERAERLLRFLVLNSPHIGEILELADPFHRANEFDGLDLNHPSARRQQSALAWSESTEGDELDFLVDFLGEQNWVTKGRTIKTDDATSYSSHRASYLCRVEIPGYSRIEELSVNVDSAQCFVAMWFHDSMNEVYRNGIEPAIKAAGYSPYRIDREDFVGKIDDKIIAEIRRSRFIVADFTQGGDGARGGVYYEAGFAEGHGLDVIFTCRSDIIDKVHFDTRQQNHIVWDSPDDLRERLENRIRRVIGEGPNANGIEVQK